MKRIEKNTHPRTTETRESSVELDAVTGGALDFNFDSQHNVDVPEGFDLGGFLGGIL